MVIVPSGWYRVSLALADSISFYETILSEKDTLTAVTDNNVWRPQFRQYQLAYCYDPKEIHNLPGVEKGSGLHTWLKDAIQKITTEEALTGILSVLLQCGSTLALDKSMPNLGVHSLSTCTPAAWKQCRKSLEGRIKEKGVAASLAWLPKQAPTSLDDIPAETPTKAQEEL